MDVKLPFNLDAVTDHSVWENIASTVVACRAVTLRRAWRPLVLMTTTVVLLYHFVQSMNLTDRNILTSGLNTKSSNASVSDLEGTLLIHNPFKFHSISGFDGSGKLDTEVHGKSSEMPCATFAHAGTIGIQNSLNLSDSLVQIALSLDDHPAVQYPKSLFEASMKMEDLVKQTWSRVGGSCAWLADHEVYFCVTRIIFHLRQKQGDRVISSFARARLFDRGWLHLDGHKLKWGNQTFEFPRTLGVPIELHEPLKELGPEDPRIVIEDGVQGAEPVLIFNMISSKSDWRRAMWIFRPFSQHSAVLKFRDGSRPLVEKSWAPLFVRPDPFIGGQPSTTLHFVYNFRPLEILKCSLIDGLCDLIFDQSSTVPARLLTQGNNNHTSLRGGTNWVPFPLYDPATFSSLLQKPGTNFQAFVSFSQTSAENPHCKGAVSRPAMVVMVTNTTHFITTYASHKIDFGNAVISPEQLKLPCDEGRVLTVNSIARWEALSVSSNSSGHQDSLNDIMTLAVSVADQPAQVVRLAGVLQFIRELPWFQTLALASGSKSRGYFFDDTPESGGSDGAITPFMRHSANGDHVRACLEGGSMEYITNRT